MDLAFQLGHPPGHTCPHPKQFWSIFTVLALNGIHRVKLWFCNCRTTILSEDERTAEYNRQLLKVGWWPSTNTEPQSAATIELLRLFRLLNLNGALAASEFYRSLEDLTDPEGLQETSQNSKSSGKDDNDDIPVSLFQKTANICIYHVTPSFQERLHQLMNMVRQYRHVTNLVHSGRGHDPLGVLATKAGELTGLCRACPHKETLPDNVDSLPPSSR
jgi:hypothetical protein